jgi:N-acetylglutamate synthase
MDATFKPKMRTALPKSKPQDLELIAALEERLLHVWPAVTTHMIDGWAVRFAGGYTGWVELGSILMDAKHRGKGLGRALVSTLLNWAADQNVEKAFLQVDVSNVVALGLYRSFDFKVLYDYDTLFLPVN